MAADSPGTFAGVLRELRTRARLTQQGLAERSGVSLRTLSDLERGVAATPQKETVRLLGDALGLAGAERARFETAARGHPVAGGSVAAAAAVMRSLPADVASFTGRQRELEQLVKSAVTAGGVVAIHAIGGMAGVGKTAFAVHAAHRLAGQFPGGQIFLRLHGHTPGQQPVEPADALASLLLALGVHPARVPPGLASRAALWRDQVADKRLLLVLDDAAGSEQVQPLLPGAGGSLVLVTSRRHLSALDDATTVSLDTLPPAEAAALLVRLAGRPGLSSSDPGVREIIALCGFLPLAVGLVARQLRHHPAWTAVHRAAELASARDRLELMQTEHLSVAAAFDLSYATLSPAQQQLFRRIGLHPGADVDAYAAAALDGSSLSGARQGLEALYDQYLLTEPTQGRYRPHDLIREHARALATRIDPEQDRTAATARLLDYYQHSAAVADVWIRGRSRPGASTSTSTSIGPLGETPALDDQRQALAWARAERASLLACLDYAAATGQHARVTALTAGLSGLFQHDGPLTEAVGRHVTAIAAARMLGDQLSLANALIDLGSAAMATGDYPAAGQFLAQALGIYRDLGERLGQANTLHHLADVRYFTGEYPEAVQVQQQALNMYRELGDRHGQARALSQLGEVWRLTNDYPAAARALREALGVYRQLGDRYGQARALSGLGGVAQLTGDYPAAAQAQEQALNICRELGNRLGQANTLTFLGDVRRLTGDYPAAARAQKQALELYRDLGNRLGQGNALCRLGSALTLTGDYPAAGRALDEALAIHRDLGDVGSQAVTLNERGTLHRVSGELALARGCHQESLALSREIDSTWDEAHALAGLGRCALADGQGGGQGGQARDLLRQALEIFRRIGAAEIGDVSTELDALDAAS